LASLHLPCITATILNQLKAMNVATVEDLLFSDRVSNCKIDREKKSLGLWNSSGWRQFIPVQN